MKQIWYIQVLGEQEGPYSLEQLQEDERVTPDTLVWRKGMKVWTKARDVPELKKIFKDKKTQESEESSELLPDDELVLDWRDNQMDPNNLYILLLLALLLMICIIYELYT